VVAAGGDGTINAIATSLGGYAIVQALKDDEIQAAQVIEPRVLRHIALAMVRTGEVTLSIRTVMQEVPSVARQLGLC
jgi:hypothetical protein